MPVDGRASGSCADEITAGCSVDGRPRTSSSAAVSASASG
jgi:hypothetical protein